VASVAVSHLAKHLPGTASVAFTVASGEHLRGQAWRAAAGPSKVRFSTGTFCSPHRGAELARFLRACGSPTSHIPAATQLILSLVDLATSAAANLGLTRADPALACGHRSSDEGEPALQTASTSVQRPAAQQGQASQGSAPHRDGAVPRPPA
jgi:hypothetical protein